MHDLGTASILGTVAMVCALLVTAIHLCITDMGKHTETHVVAPAARHDMPQTFVAILDAVFAFGGQENWVRWAIKPGIAHTLIICETPVEERKAFNILRPYPCHGSIRQLEDLLAQQVWSSAAHACSSNLLCW